jgi:tRNA dimethylallyltransferase
VPKQVLAIVGATATGKSALADALAHVLDGEVVSADSMQVYKGMDIGTGKIPFAERSVPYHCLDLVDPNQDFNVALYQRAARQSINDILTRGRLPVLCGGSGLYIRAALDAFDLDGAERPCDPALRQQLAQEAKSLSSEQLHALLAERDSQSATLIHPHNRRRVLRALELLEQGDSYAQKSRNFSAFRPYFDTCYLGLDLPPVDLYQRIGRRVDHMIATGLLQEVEDLVAAGFRQALSARQAIGYKELLPVLDDHALLDTAISYIKQATRRYAKRQRSWFRRDLRIQSLDASVPTGRLVHRAFCLAQIALGR